MSMTVVVSAGPRPAHSHRGGVKQPGQQHLRATVTPNSFESHIAFVQGARTRITRSTGRRIRLWCLSRAPSWSSSGKTSLGLGNSGGTSTVIAVARSSLAQAAQSIPLPKRSFARRAEQNVAKDLPRNAVSRLPEDPRQPRTGPDEPASRARALSEWTYSPCSSVPEPSLRLSRQ